MPAKDLDTWLGEATNLTDTEIKTATEQCRAAGVHTLGQLIQHLKTSSINELFSDALVRSEVDKGLQAKERAPLTMRLVRQFSTWRFSRRSNSMRSWARRWHNQFVVRGPALPLLSKFPSRGAPMRCTSGRQWGAGDTPICAALSALCVRPHAP